MSDLFTLTADEVKQAKEGNFPKAVFKGGDKATLLLKEIKEKPDFLIFSFTVQDGENEGKEYAEFFKPDKPMSKKFAIDMMESSFGTVVGHSMRELVSKRYTVEFSETSKGDKVYINPRNWSEVSAGGGAAFDANDVPF